MEPRITERFNENILAQAAGRYGVDASAVHKLASAESYIYEFVRDGEPFILRIGHSLRRTVDLIAGEVDWINYLAHNMASGGASVAKAILSDNGELVEQIDDGVDGDFLATSFIKAPGRRPTEEDLTPAFIQRYGQAIGQMHRLTKAYEPTNSAWQRPHWDGQVMHEIRDFLPSSEKLAGQKLDGLIAALRQLPQDRESYGLVHQDAHGGNYFVDEAGALTFFDFDDCAYTWFASDVAIVLFYAITGKEDPSAFAHYFLPHFLRGYQRENQFDRQWFAHMPAFLKLRELELYAVVHRSFDVENLTHPWVKGFMDGRKARVECDVPYINLDFANLNWA